MADPITLSTVGAIALTEGIKFLYKQAGEVLKWWMKRRDAKEAPAEPDETAAVDVKLPDVFGGQLSEPKIHFKALERLGGELWELRKDFSEYADEIAKVDTKDEDLLKRIDALRKMLEAVYQQRITFEGEQRSSSGPLVEGRIDVEEVAGYVAAIRAKRISRGKVTAEVEAERVEEGGQVIGVEVDEIS